MKKNRVKRKKVSGYTFRNVLDDIARKYKNSVALKIFNNDEFKVSYYDLRMMADSLSQFFINKGIQKGDKVAILGETSPYWLISYFAITSIGAIAVPILPNFSKADVTDLLDHSKPRVLIVNKKHLDKCLGFVNNKDNIVLRLEDLNEIKTDDEFTISSSDEFARVEGEDTIHSILDSFKNIKKRKYVPSDILKQRAPNEDDIASLIYTSGTTGKPKGVLLTHKNLVWNADESTDVFFKVKKGYRVLSILPISHVYEFTVGQILTLLCGVEIHYLMKKPAVSILFKALRTIRPQIICTVPLLIEKIYKTSVLPQLKDNPKITKLMKSQRGKRYVCKIIGRKINLAMGGKIKFFGIGGAGLDSEVEQFLYNAQFPYAIGYGLTETSPLLAGCGPKDHNLGVVGKILPHVEMRLSNINPITGVGEIEVKSPGVMKGYYNNDEFTAEAFTEDGFFKTGDLGSFDKKKRLSLKGRTKEMILLSGGENIYPEYIESKINKKDFVEESLVIPKNGGLVAMIKLDIENFAKSISMDIDTVKTNFADLKNEATKYIKKITEAINKDLMSNSQLDGVELQDEPFKRTPTEKIKRFLYSGTKHQKSDE